MSTVVVGILDYGPDDVFIGRPGPWGNPCRMKGEAGRDAAVDGFIAHLRRSPHIVSQIHRLRGKRLVCYCAPRRCHGDVLAALADGVPLDCVDLFT